MVGEVPEGWRSTRLGEQFVRVQRKNTAGIERVLTASGEQGLVDQGDFFNKRVAGRDLGGYIHLKRGEFAYNRSSMNGYPCGAIKRLDRYNEGVVSTLYLCMALRSGAPVDADFAAQMFDSPILEAGLRPIAKVGARAHGLLNVTPDDFFELSFPLPPLPEQQKIAAILSSVDEAIQATQAVIDQTRRVKEGLLQDLLTRGLPGHTRFKQTEIGEIPEEWCLACLGDLASFHNGDRGKNYPSSDEYAVSGMPFINTGHIDPNGTLSLERMNYISKSKFETLAGGKIQPGDVVYCLRGATLGKTAIVDPLTDGAIASSLVIIRPNGFWSSKYLYYYLIGDLGRAELRKHDNGSAQPNLAVSSVSQYLVPLPPISEQQEIIAILSSMDATIEVGQERLGQLHRVKSGLLQDLLTGKVRVIP